MRFPLVTGITQYVERKATPIGNEDEFEGLHGTICRLTPGDKAIKVAAWGKKKEIKNEFKVGQALFEAGISVPRHYELAWAGFDLGLGVKFPVWGLVRDYVEGITLLDLLIQNQEKYGLATEMMNKELGKARKLGFDTGRDAHVGNAIWTPDERVVLIDFAPWRTPR